MARPLVTVLIDSYNYGHYIEEAIESVLSQDFPAEETEILVVDDGSTDNTAERVRKYDGRIQYLWKPNGGQASAFNFGLRRAKGEIVALLDADDYWLPGKLRRIAEEFEKHPDAGMVYHGIRQFNSREGTFEDGGLPSSVMHPSPLFFASADSKGVSTGNRVSVDSRGFEVVFFQREPLRSVSIDCNGVKVVCFDTDSQTS